MERWKSGEALLTILTKKLSESAIDMLDNADGREFLALDRYFSTLATTQHVTDAVSEAMEPLDATVDSLKGAVDGLGDLATTDDVTAAVSAATEPLNEAVDSLEGTVDGLGDLATKSDVTAAVSEAVKPLDEAVGNLNGTVDRLSGTVARLEGTLSGWEIAIETLNGTVQTLNGTVQTLNDKVDGLDGSLDTLNVTFPLFMSCVMELHGPWTAGGRGDRPAPSLDSVPICRQARELVNSLAASGR